MMIKVEKTHINRYISYTIYVDFPSGKDIRFDSKIKFPITALPDMERKKQWGNIKTAHHSLLSDMDYLTLYTAAIKDEEAFQKSMQIIAQFKIDIKAHALKNGIKFKNGN